MKSKNNKETAVSPLIPMQVKARGDVREKLIRVAAANGLSLNDVATLAMSAGLSLVEQKLAELNCEGSKVS